MFVVVRFPMFRGIFTTLLKTNLIIDWFHNGLVPFTKCNSVLESLNDDREALCVIKIETTRRDDKGSPAMLYQKQTWRPNKERRVEVFVQRWCFE